MINQGKISPISPIQPVQPTKPVQKGLQKGLQTTDGQSKEVKINSGQGATVLKEAGSPASVITPSEVWKLEGYNNQGHLYNKVKVDEMKTDLEKRLDDLKNTVERMLEKQGLKFKDVSQALDRGETVTVEIDEETRLAAQAEISEDGHWGVKKTAERMVDFAKALSGDDKSKYEQLKTAIEEGFAAAKEAFGGELPEISKQTLDTVLKSLAEWAGVSSDPKVEV